MPCLWQDIWEQNLMLVPATDRARDKNQETIQLNQICSFFFLLFSSGSVKFYYPTITEYP